MEKRGLGVDLLEELLARHRRREHAKGAFSRAPVALGARRRAAIRERDRVEACAEGASQRRRMGNFRRGVVPFS